MADAFHAGSRIGLTRAMRMAERRLGRRLVAGD
jgi:hypothetical protein